MQISRVIKRHLGRLIYVGCKMKNVTKITDIVDSGVSVSVGIVLFSIVGALLFFNGWQKSGIFTFILAILCMGLYLLLYIPQAHRISVTNKGITFYSYKKCRNHFWKEIKDIKLVEDNEGTTSKTIIIAQIYESLSKKDQSNPPYYEVPINAELYGYEPRKLFEILNEKSPNKPINADRKTSAV